ncbi:MAG TPA: translation elongation factor Ts [Candidatus Polarisedimenticolia bacterium]|nr:translation elongation factor Ts [Candidatus Polarisedimenticolia bacterium]
MEITAEMVRSLREKSGAGIMECKTALAESKGDPEHAFQVLRKRGLASVAKRAGRTTSEGTVASYIHPGGRVGVLLEVNCETDFVARTAEFQELVRNLAMHIAASQPRFVAREDVPEAILGKEREIYLAQARSAGRPEAALSKIVEGKVGKFYQDSCLLEQPYVKDPNQTVTDYLSAVMAKTGENIRVRRFVRFALGESLSSDASQSAPAAAEQA